MQLIYGLLIVQAISYSWATPSDTNIFFVGVDLLGVGLLATAIFFVGTQVRLSAILLPVLVVAAFCTLESLLTYYSSHALASRFWFPFIYKSGLNPVLTGFICGFSVLLAGHQVAVEAQGPRRTWFKAALVITLLGLLATQSRGPWLACVVGWMAFLVFGRRRMMASTLIVVVTALSYFVVLQVASQSWASNSIVSRGATGRFDIYRSYFERMEPIHWWVGKGWGSTSSLPEDVLGWLVHHPHSAYMTQFYLTGGLGLVLLLCILLQGLLNGIAVYQRENNYLGLALLASGAAAVLFDGGHIFSLGSVARVEFLLVATPLLLLAGARQRSQAAPKKPAQLE